MGTEGMGVVVGVVVERPQHELTKTRENVRVFKVLTQMKRKWSQNPRLKVTRDNTAYLSCDYMSVQSVGLPSMHHTQIDDVTFHVPEMLVNTWVIPVQHAMYGSDMNSGALRRAIRRCIALIDSGIKLPSLHCMSTRGGRDMTHLNGPYI